ncbi:pyridine nucleotide-disulfide oxidoreductase [Rhizoctonia solani]|uniref:Pyridine nucleotide-disulfide oxidoreductase n=1 Tax=Rhizoctonia solani TaxID=456999 RepID=A0A8H8NWZ5_9AGAM|nr:pyridine nucleotide-disulfide oxidoreductase [Rhizoctonia solani]QRW19622.1 pyridine nucleotide-disulfide oxidoreductase [Rhizoctonia solani]
MAQSTTSKTTHNIIKYASHKVPLSAQVPTNEIQWKSHEGEHLRLTIAVTAVRAPSGSGTQPMARHVLKIVYLSEDVEENQNASQSMASEALLENLDLTSFSEIKYSGRELPLKAVYKNRSVAFRYLYPMIQGGNTPQTYRRFQVTFKTADDALNFIDSIKYICPCSTARDQRPTETHVTEQANSTHCPPLAMVIEGSAKTAPPRRIAPINRPITPSRISNPPLPRNATTYRKSTMFADMLSSPSLGTGNSQARGAPGSSSGSSASGGKSANPTQVKPTMDEVVIDRGELVDEPNHIIVDEGPLTEPGRAEATNISQVGRAIAQHAPSPNQPEETQFSAPTRVGTNQSRAHVQVSREGQQLQPRAIEILHAAEETPGESTKIVPGIRQLRDASDIYTMPFDELQQLVAEVKKKGTSDGLTLH